VVEFFANEEEDDVDEEEAAVDVDGDEGCLRFWALRSCGSVGCCWLAREEGAVGRAVGAHTATAGAMSAGAATVVGLLLLLGKFISTRMLEDSCRCASSLRKRHSFF
jgi:hypothetical protein